MQPNRRQFVVTVAISAAACGGLTSCAMMGPSGPRHRQASGPVDVGTPADYPADGISDRWAESDGFYLVRDHGRLFAVSGDCTHKHCLVEPEREGKQEQFACGCHGSRFTPDGQVIKGPARLPLPHLAIWRDPRGHVIVDPTKHLDESQRDQADTAFIAV